MLDRKSTNFLFIAPTPFYANRGCHMRIRGEAEALRDKGYEVIILTYKEGGDVPGLKIIRSQISVGGFKNGVAATWKNIPAGIFLFWIVLHETYYHRPDVLYGHLFEGAAIGIAVKYLVVILSLFRYKPILVLDTQGGLSEEMKSYKMINTPILLKIIRWLEIFILFFPDFVFTSSIQCAKTLKKISQKTNPVCLPDGISIFNKNISLQYVNKFKGSNGKEKSLSKISYSFSTQETALIKKWIKFNNPILLYTGSYSLAKGFPEFVKRAMPELLKKENFCFLFGGGDSRNITYLNDLIKNNPDRIISLSDLNSKNLLYFSLLGDIAIDCKPSTTTESSGKILNYMAAGLPVVCFNQENNHLFLGNNGLYADNFSEFSQLVLKLANDTALRTRLARANLERSWGKFTWDLQVEKMLSILNSSK